MAFLEVHHFREVPKWWAIWKFKRWEDAIFDIKNTKKQLEPLCSPFSVENRHPKRPFVHHDGHHTNSKETLGLSLRDLLQFYPSTFVSCHDSKVPNHAASFPGLLQKHIFYFQICIYIQCSVAHTKQSHHIQIYRENSKVLQLLKDSQKWSKLSCLSPHVLSPRAVVGSRYEKIEYLGICL